MEEKEMLTEEITLRLVKEIKRFLLEDALALSRSSDEQLMVRIKEIIDHKLVHYEITPQEREKIARRVFSSLRGLGILDELLDDDSITETDAWNIDSKLERAMAALHCPPGDWPVTNLSGGEDRKSVV